MRHLKTESGDSISVFAHWSFAGKDDMTCSLETDSMSAKNVLLSAFVALQIADVLTTQHVLAAGGFEANPLEVWAMEHFGAWWLLAKLAPMALVAMVMTRWPPRFIVCRWAYGGRGGQQRRAGE
jgi:hypothetical protein